MDQQLLKDVEDIIGTIRRVNVLDDQGCTSEVLQIFTDDSSYLLKSSFKEKYLEWLKAEAQVLESLNNKNLIRVPNYMVFSRPCIVVI